MIEPLNSEAIRITDFPGLDTIDVFWSNTGEGRGSVTITCWGSAWTAYFAAMSGRTIQQFFASAGTDYLVTKLGITHFLKQRKSDMEYLARIVEAVKAATAEKKAA